MGEGDARCPGNSARQQRQHRIWGKVNELSDDSVAYQKVRIVRVQEDTCNRNDQKGPHHCHHTDSERSEETYYYENLLNNLQAQNEIRPADSHHNVQVHDVQRPQSARDTQDPEIWDAWEPFLAKED